MPLRDNPTPTILTLSNHFNNTISFHTKDDIFTTTAQFPFYSFYRNTKIPQRHYFVSPGQIEIGVGPALGSFSAGFHCWAESGDGFVGEPRGYLTDHGPVKN